MIPAPAKTRKPNSEKMSPVASAPMPPVMNPSRKKTPQPARNLERDGFRASLLGRRGR